MCYQRLLRLAAAGWCGLAGLGSSAVAQQAPAAPCDGFLPAPREAGGRKVGPSSCLSLETALSLEQRAFVRLDVGLDGTVEGYLPTVGDHKGYLTNAPDLVFLQAADAGPRVFAVATYERDKGAAMTVVFPRDVSAWNGKMWRTDAGDPSPRAAWRCGIGILIPPIRCATWTSTIG